MAEDFTQKVTLAEGHPFTGLGFHDIERGAEIFDMLEISEATFREPREFLKVKEIAEFFNMIPDSTFQVRRALSRKVNSDISNIDHIAAFVQLHKSLRDVKNKEEQLKVELAFYE